MESKCIPAKNRCIVKRTIYASIGLVGILLAAGILFSILPLSSTVASAGSNADSTASYNSEVNTPMPDQTLNANAANNTQTTPRMRRMTNAQRQEAAVRIAAARIAAARQAATVGGGNGVKSTAATITTVTAAVPAPGGVPDYFGTTPNYANSPLPTVNPVNGTVSGGIRKFVDSLPGLGPAGANNLGQYIPIAVADTTTYPGSEYYIIALVQYTEKMHSDLPATTLRGYVQVETPANVGVSKHIPLKYPNGSPIVSSTGQVVYAVDNPHYLGPLVIAQKDLPVRVKFINYLPKGSGGNLFLPVDTTVMGAGMGPLGMNVSAGYPMNYTQNRATLHLHGGNTPWISDGTQHQWTTPAGEKTNYPKGVSVRYVPDMDNGTEPQGTLTFYYTNQQSARLMFYHDHAYGITRLNVYAGEAAGYLLQDPVEQGLVTSGVIPADQIPLVIQDKTFVDATTIGTQDPTWNWGATPPTPHTGDLWFPHVYMTNQNPSDITGANPMGRWDYGPWFWPPFTGLVNGPVPNPLNGTTPQEGPFNPGTPNPSIVPEAFMDTPVTNGNPYPYVQLGHKAYRFRILNAGNDRTLNLQLYYAATAGPFVTITGGGGTGASAVATVNATGSVTGITLTNGGIGYTSAPTVNIFDAPGHTPAGIGATAIATVDLTMGIVTDITPVSGGSGYAVPTICNGTAVPNPRLCTEVSMVPATLNPAIPFPSSWKAGTPGFPPDILDGRAGGVPDPRSIGPSMIQIGTEGGFMPAPMVIPNIPIGYEKNTRNIVVGNVLEKSLFLGPAERADVIVDFSAVPNGSTLILYNDAPAPVPAFDMRYDYYTDDLDQTSTGGAPSTLPGYGPNTRTIMQLQINAALGTAPAYNLSALQAALPAAYAAYQDKPIMPQAAYNTAFNATYPADAFARIQDTTMTFLPAATTQPVRSITVTAGGTNYTIAPTVNITGGGGTGATARATLATAGFIKTIAVTNGGTGYTTAPAVAITGGGGTGAAATATLGFAVASVTVTNGGTGYTSTPAVNITGGGGKGATAIAQITNGNVTGITVTNGGTGYTSSPNVTITGGGGRGARATTRLATAGSVKTITVTNRGTGYTSAPTVAITGGGGTGATATAVRGLSVASITVTNGGSGYTSAPTVAITGGGGTGATATASLTLKMAMQPKAIQELFDPNYGRMNALLGVEIPNTNFNTQTTIPYTDIDPPTEIIMNSDAAAPLGTLADGTQIWKITHNGVDTHALHWHMFNVQVINRVGWDGAIRMPDPNELGWKDTVRMNPLEDIIVALRPIIPNIPWELPNSIRPLDVTAPIGSTVGFFGVDPTGQPAPVINQNVNFGWEYVWHCHLLGHEENIMMRPIIVAVAPNAPSALTATVIGTGSTQSVRLTWIDNSTNENSFAVQRATAATGPWTTLSRVTSATGPRKGATVIYNNTLVSRNTTYYYRVLASNLVGYTKTYAAPAAGYPNMRADSTPSNTGTVTTG